MRHTVPFMFCLFAFGCVFAHCIGCKSPTTSAQAAAEGAYGAELVRCVDAATTLAESKACRATVDAKWGVVQTAAKDGGVH